MNLSRALTLLIFVSLVADWSWGQSEETRLSGFAEQRKNQQRFGKAREQGERAYLEEEEQWENQKNRNLEEYKKGKRQDRMNDDGPEAKADAAAKKAYLENYDKARKEFNAQRSKQETRRAKIPIYQLLRKNWVWMRHDRVMIIVKERCSERLRNLENQPRVDLLPGRKFFWRRKQFRKFPSAAHV